jgi:hypothetical protein
VTIGNEVLYRHQAMGDSGGAEGSSKRASGVRPGYGWAVGAFGFAFLAGFLGWLAIVMSHRIRRTSTNIVWQATLAVAIAAALVGVLLAVGAWLGNATLRTPPALPWPPRWASTRPHHRGPRRVT